MFATSEGTTRYTDRFPEFRDAAFYRSVMGLEIASLGIGTYLGGLDDAADAAYIDALVAAGESGINLFDCAISYRQQRSERCIEPALQHRQRDERSWSAPRQDFSRQAPCLPRSSRSMWWAACTRWILIF